jgi:hypothetical protein
MDTEIQRADRHLRRRTSIVLVAAAIAAIATLAAATHWMHAHAFATDPRQLIVEMRRWLAAVAFGCAACVFALAFHAWSRARRASAERRWPLQAARLLRDARIRRGDEVLPVVRMLNLVAAMLTLVGIAAAVLAVRLLTR